MNRIKQMFTALIVAVGLISTQSGMAASPASVNLGTASNFTILAATAVSTDGGGGIINGDVGLSPEVGSKITFLTSEQVNGTIYTVDVAGPAGSVMDPARLSLAHSDLSDAYDDAKLRSTDRITVSGNIGNSTLAPGLYWSESSIQITGNLTLDAGGDPNAVWIFQMGTTLITADGAPGTPASQVILSGGAQAKNIFWQVGSSATLGTYSVFKGNILAYVTITMDVGSVMEGRALAQTGAVTFNGGGSGSLPTLLEQEITAFMPTNNSDFVGTSLVGLSATASSGLTVSFTVASGPGEITGGTNLAFSATGQVSVVASQAGNVDYKAASNVVHNYNVLPAAEPQSQTITNFLPITGSEFAGTNLVRLSATASSGLTVSFTVASGPGLITEGTNLAFTSTGQVFVVASQAGGEFYEAAPSLTNTYTVMPADKQTQAITGFVPINGSEFAGTYKARLVAEASSSLPVSFTVASGPGLINEGTNLLFTSTGQVSVVASQAGSEFYEAAPSLTNTYTVLPADMLAQTITGFLPADGSEFLGTNVVGLSAKASSGLPVSYSVASGPGRISGETNLLFSATGKVSVVASQAGSDFYETAPSITHTFTVYEPVYGIFDDYNGDGRSDLAVFDDVNGLWYILSATGELILWNGSWGWNGAVPVSGDYDGDGVSDLAVFDDVNGIWYVISASGNLILWNTSWGWNGAVPVSGDYDGDGVSDLAVFDDVNGIWYVISASGNLILWDTWWGWDGAIPVSGDYDGDNVSDLTVFDAVSGLWFSMSPTTGGVISWRLQWGWEGAIPVSGDYDGDGIHDMAVFDDINGLWYIISLTGEIIAWELQWGWEGAVPVSGDYDGDGIYDLAVFDDINGLWYILTISGDVIAWELQWGWDGAVPLGAIL